MTTTPREPGSDTLLGEENLQHEREHLDVVHDAIAREDARTDATSPVEDGHLHS